MKPKELREGTPAFKNKWIEIDGLLIHYLNAGETGPPVLLLHGGGLDSASLSYKFCIGPLAEHHRVYAPDWPGYGESDKPEMEYTTGFFIDFLGRFLNALGLERASLIGLSMGGGIAAGFTLVSPGSVAKLVLVDSWGLGGDIPIRRFVSPAVRLPFIKVFLRLSLRNRRIIRRFSLVAVSNRRTVEEELDEIHRLAAIPGIEKAFLSWLRSEFLLNGLRSNFVESLHKIMVPTLVLHGKKDSLIPVSLAYKAHTLIKGSELHVFQECGHLPPRENPDEFNRVVSSFLLKNQPAG